MWSEQLQKIKQLLKWETVSQWDDLKTRRPCIECISLWDCLIQQCAKIKLFGGVPKIQLNVYKCLNFQLEKLGQKYVNGRKTSMNRQPYTIGQKMKHQTIEHSQKTPNLHQKEFLHQVCLRQLRMLASQKTWHRIRSSYVLDITINETLSNDWKRTEIGKNSQLIHGVLTNAIVFGPKPLPLRLDASISASVHKRNNCSNFIKLYKKDVTIIIT